VYTYNAADQSWTTPDASGGAATTTNTAASSGGAATQPQTIVQQIDTSGLATSSGMNQGFNSVLGDTGNILNDTSQIKSDVGQVQTGMNQGFADVGGQLTGLGNQIGNNQTALTGQISDLSGNVGTAIGTLGGAVNTGFADVNQNITGNFDAQNRNLSDMSSNILGGQTNLQNYLEGMSGRADTYYGGLAEGQSNIMGEVGGLQSGFADFRNTYDDNTTMANQTRNQLIDQVTGGFGAQEQAQAEYNAAAQKERADIQSTIAQQASVAPAAGTSYAPALRDMAAGNAATTVEQANAQTEAASRINAVKQLLTTSGQNLNADLRMQYETVANAFDDNGRLIPLSTDPQGNRTQRSLDGQSNLLATTINAANQVTDQRAVNVDRLLGYLDQLGYTGNSGGAQLTRSGLMGSTVNTFS
jgi:YD repeat-containing protein